MPAATLLSTGAHEIFTHKHLAREMEGGREREREWGGFESKGEREKGKERGGERERGRDRVRARESNVFPPSFVPLPLLLHCPPSPYPHQGPG